MLPYSKSLIIMPTYNEAQNIRLILEVLKDLYPEISILVIDDGSPDGTANIVKEIQQQRARIYILEREGKLGLGTAYLTGFRWALQRDFEYIFEMDSDFSHDPKDVQNLLRSAQENDLVIGSRYINGVRIINWPFKRLLLSYGASIYTRFITGLKILDVTGGFKCFKRSTLETINLDRITSTGYCFQVELNYKAWCLGLKVKEVPIIFTERRDGQSKMSGGIFKEAVLAVIMLRIRKIFNRLN